MELRHYTRAWQDRSAREAHADARWCLAVRARLPEAVRLLQTRYGAQRVTLFGSLTRGEATRRSDVDLLVDGLRMGQLIDATNDVQRALGVDTVDLVPASHAPAFLRQRIEAEGEVLVV